MNRRFSGASSSRRCCRRSHVHFLEMVIGASVATGHHEQRDISPCSQLVGILHKSGLELPEDVVRHQPVGTAPSTRPTPEMRSRSAQMEHQIEVLVQSVRQTLFGQPSAPSRHCPRPLGGSRSKYGNCTRVLPHARTLYQPLWDHAMEASPLVGEPGTVETSQRLTVFLDAMQAGVIGSIAPAEHAGLQEDGRHDVVDAPAWPTPSLCATARAGEWFFTTSCRRLSVGGYPTHVGGGRDQR